MKAPRYLAILDPRQAGEAAAWSIKLARRHDLVRCVDTDTLTVFVTAKTPHALIENTGIVVGDLYAAGTSTRVQRLILATGQAPETLIAECWGDYVAIARSDDDQSIVATRSPSGGLHAFRVRRDDLVFLCSDIELLIELDLVAPAIDWSFVTHHLAFSHLHTSATGLTDVDEIVPGDCAIETEDGAARRNLWTPWAFATPERRVGDFNDAARLVRNAILQSVAAAVAPDARVALELSGGLDSSIVAAALALNGRSAIAINLSTPGAEGDERDYARAVSHQTGIPLFEMPIKGDIDLTHVTPRIEARPGMLAMLRLADEGFAKIGGRNAIDGFINGTGGDCVFCSLGTSAPAADRARAQGFRPGTVATIRDIARIHGSNVWTVAKMTARRLQRRHGPPSWRRNTLFLNDARLPDAPHTHSWLAEPPDALDGTRAHIHAILASYSHLDGYGRHAIAPSIFPLLSQPVVEACLSIPSWLWVQGGRDRAVARAAFAVELPRFVAERRTKGAMDAFCARTFEINRARLRPFLLDGMLNNAGLLDCSSVEAYLARPFANRDRLFYQFLPIIDAELWARAIASMS